MRDLAYTRHTVSSALLVLAALASPGGAEAQLVCSITQITSSTAGDSEDASLDEGAIAFSSTADLTGENADGSAEIFLYDGTSIVQITDSSTGDSTQPSLDGGAIAFASTADLTGENADGNEEIFLFDGSSITQITNDASGVPAGDSTEPSLDAGVIAFRSRADHTGENDDDNHEIFIVDGGTFDQITSTAPGHIAGGGNSFAPSLDGTRIAFDSDADITGGNPDGGFEVFLFDGSSTEQITDSATADSGGPSLEAGILAFRSEADLTGENPDGSAEIFVFDGTVIVQVTSAAAGTSESPSVSGGWIAFESSSDLLGQNADGEDEIFLFDGSRLFQVTAAIDLDSGDPDLDGTSIAFQSEADLTGENPDGNDEIFLATCSVLAPAAEVPAIGNLGLAALALLLAAAGVALLRRLGI